MPKEKLVNVTILVEEAHKDNLSEVATALKVKGFVLKESLDAVGVLIGKVPAAAITGLSATPGVSAVEEDRTDYHTQ